MNRKSHQLGARSAARVVVAAMLLFVSACGSKPSGAFPTQPSPRDGAVIDLVIDSSCDETVIPGTELRDAIYGLVTEAAWHEGTFGLATLRSNALLKLNFRYVHFASESQGTEAIRRDLQSERDAVSVPSFMRFVRGGGTGACQTDLLGGMQQIQAELSATASGGQPVTVVLVTNGIVVSHGVDFRRVTIPAARLVRRYAADGEIAKLPGVQLVLVGIGRSHGISERKAAWLDRFWIDYARAAGATPTLVRSTADLNILVRSGS